MKQRLILSFVLLFGALFIAEAQPVEKAAIPPITHFVLELIRDDTALRIRGYTGYAKSIEIPAQIQGFPVKEVCELNNGYVTNLVIPEGVENIEKLGCWNLLSVKLPSILTVIGEDAFYQADLTSVELPKNLKVIGSGAFKSSDLKSIKFPEGLEVIGDGAFCGCKLTSVTLPSSVRIVGEGAFSYCDSLEQINIGEDYKINFGATDWQERDEEYNSTTAASAFEGDKIDHNLALKMKLKNMKSNLTQEEVKALMEKYEPLYTIRGTN